MQNINFGEDPKVVSNCSDLCICGAEKLLISPA